MNAGHKRLKLLLLTLAILACSVVALGGTLASNDSINTMDYKVSLLCYNPATNQYDLPVYGENAYHPYTADVLWCPGYTKIVYLKIVNEEEFPVESELDIIFESNGFGKMLSYAVIYGLQPNTQNHPENWAEFKDRANISGVLEKNALLAPNRSSYKVAKLAQLDPDEKGARYYALAIHMDEKTPNEYQGQSMDLNFYLRVNAKYETGFDPN